MKGLTFWENRFLRTFFMTDVFLSDGKIKRAAFDCLAEIFNVKDAGSFAPVCFGKDVGAINSVKKYYLHKRMCDYYAETGKALPLGEEEDMIEMKGQALIALEEQKLLSPHHSAGTEADALLSAAANRGVIPAMLVFGLMLCEGFSVSKSRESGLNMLKKAARWNNPEANLMCLYYDRANRGVYGDRLYSALFKTLQSDCMGEVFTRYCLDPREDAESSVLEMSFGRGIADRNIYDQAFARILFCGNLSITDKRNVLLLGNKDALSVMTSLPLNTTPWAPCTPHLDPAPLERPAETEILNTVLSNAHRSSERTYRPLCMCTDEAYIADIYANAIAAAFPSENVQIIDVGELAPDLFTYSRNNAVLRGCREKLRNLVVFRLSDNIGEQKYQVLRDFLRTDRRKQFMVDLGVELDAVDLFPVCIADSANAERLKADCKVVFLMPLSEAECRAAINGAIADSNRAFGCNLTLSKDAEDLLVREEIGVALETVYKLFPLRGNETVISASRMKDCLNESRAVRTLGFGGGRYVD